MNAILSRFLRSPLGISLWGACAVIATALAFGGVLPPGFAILAAIVIGGVATAGLLMSPAGAKSVVAERDRDRADSDARILGGVAAARKRLSLLVIKNSDVRAELDRLVLAAGKYLESAVRNDRRDPVAEEAVISAVEVVNDYLLLADESASAARGRKVAEDSLVESAGRTVRALAASADEIDRRLGIAAAAADRAAAREELR